MLDNFIYWIPVFFLVILGVIDIKTYNLKNGFIPSAITTAAILISFLLNQNGIVFIFSLIIAILLFDLEFYEGMPDIKTFIICGAIMPNIIYVIYFGLILSFLGLLYKVLLKYKKFKEIPFLPVFLVSYLGMLFIIL